MAIKIEVVSDVSKVVADTGKLAEKYDDVSDSLKDLAKDGEKAGDKIEKAFKDGIGDELEKGLKDGERAAKDLAKKADSAFDAVSDDAKKAGKDVGKSQKEGFREASEGAETFADEADANAKEVAASFDGSAESILDGFQGLAAEMLSGFGPAGMIAGVALAAGIGIAVTEMQKGSEAANEMKGKAVDMVDALVEGGGRIEDADYAAIISAWGREVLEDNWLTFWANEASTKFQETAKDAKTYGVSSRDAIRAASGSAEDSKKFLDATADAWQELNKKAAQGRTDTEAGLIVYDEAAKAAIKQRDALSDLRGQAEENIKTTADAVDIYNLETDALDGTTEAAEKAADAIKEKADASSAAADAAMSVVGAENEWIETLAQMNKDIKTNGKNLDSNTAAGRANKESLVELASSANGYRDAAIAAGDGADVVTGKVQASRDAFIKAAIAAGYGATEAAGLADKYGLIPANVETLVKANGTEETKAAIDSIPEAAKTDVAVTATGTEAVKGSIAAIEGKDVTVQTKEAGAGDVSATIQGIEGKEVKIDVDDEYTVSEVQKRIDGIKGKDVPITVSIANLASIQSTLDRLTAPRSLWVTVNERPGVSAP